MKQNKKKKAKKHPRTLSFIFYGSSQVHCIISEKVNFSQLCTGATCQIRALLKRISAIVELCRLEHSNAVCLRERQPNIKTELLELRVRQWKTTYTFNFLQVLQDILTFLLLLRARRAPQFCFLARYTAIIQLFPKNV